MTDPLSIAIVTGSASRLAGGLFNSVRRSAVSLAEAGHSVAVLALDDDYATEDVANWAPLVPILAPRRGPAVLGYGAAIGMALREGAFDVVHQHGIWQAFSAQVSGWQRRTNGPVMISPRGMLDPWALRNSSWKKRVTGALYERRNLAAASCLHALNGSEADAMRTFGLTNPIAIIPNGADLPALRVSVPPAWWPGGKVLLFVGRLHPKKGAAELIEAFAHYRRAAPEAAAVWTLVVAGWDDGGHEATLRAIVARHGIGDRVILPGPVFGDEKDAVLRNATAFVLPSYSEGLPMSVLEAWAYELPVFMTAECNLPDGFLAGAAAQIRPEPEALTEMLTELLAPSAADRIKEMGQRGRALVSSKFAWPGIASRHVDVYRWMMGRDPQPPSCVRFD